MRSVQNGKINLAQAEAIRDLISAQTEAAIGQASRQIGGELSHRLEQFEQRLIKIIVLLESALEFVEDDLPAAELEAVEALLRSTKAGVTNSLQLFQRATTPRWDQVAIVGSPNVGNRVCSID